MKLTVCLDTAKACEIESLLALERECWAPEQQFSRHDFESQLRVFNDGMLVARAGDELAGMFIVTRVEYDALSDRTWQGVCDSGDLVRTFDSLGSTVCGVSLSVSRRYRRRGVGRQLVHGARSAGTSWGARRLLVGSRLPDYHCHASVPVLEYVDSKMDSQTRFYESRGLEVREILAGYFDDPDSLDYGVLMGVELA